MLKIIIMCSLFDLNFSNLCYVVESCTQCLPQMLLQYSPPDKPSVSDSAGIGKDFLCRQSTILKCRQSLVVDNELEKLTFPSDLHATQAVGLNSCRFCYKFSVNAVDASHSQCSARLVVYERKITNLRITISLAKQIATSIFFWIQIKEIQT